MQSPEDFHSDLTETRINAIADLLIETRNEAVELFDEMGGDTSWGLGCRIYDRSRSRIIQAASEWDWLSILDSTLHLVFKIGVVPVRFYRGTADDPTAKTLSQSYPELQQLSLAFPSASSDELIWRFAVEAEADGKALRVFFAGMTKSGEVRCQWMRNADEIVGHVVEFDQYEIGDGVELPAATVELPAAVEEEVSE